MAVLQKKNGTQIFLRVRGEYVDTEMLSGLVNDYDKRHLERIDREINLYGGSKEEINVACFNINDLLKENNIKKVDFFTIDTEGNELKILKTIHFEGFDIDVLLVENNYQTEEINQFMQRKGYKRIKKIGHDEVYRKKAYLTFFSTIF